MSPFFIGDAMDTSSYFELAKFVVDHKCVCSTDSCGQYMRLSYALENALNRFDREFPEKGKLRLDVIKHLCREAGRSDHFFGADNDVYGNTDQWLRTSITFNPEPVFRAERIDEAHKHARIHSNVLPCQAYWKTLRSVVCHHEATSSSGVKRSCSYRVFFQHRVLEECEKKSLSEMLKEIPKDSCALQKELKKLIEKNSAVAVSERHMARAGHREFIPIQPNDVAVVRGLNEGSDGSILEISWLNGTFVKKVFFSEVTFIKEATIASKISHPHVVCIFGVLEEEGTFSLLMEMLNEDLRTFLIERAKVTKDREPPFPLLLSLDVLMQVAQAMRHLHKVGVIHFDLKSLNILISHFEISGYEREHHEHYLLKVADFGRAQLLQFDDPSFPGFEPSHGTTAYIAPEVLEWFDCNSSDREPLRTDPKKVDVYSFGIVAFEVLTGNFEVYNGTLSPKDLKAGVKDGSLRPPLRQECREHRFRYSEQLLSLVERCWAPKPSDRPSFDDICGEISRMQFCAELDLSTSHPHHWYWKSPR